MLLPQQTRNVSVQQFPPQIRMFFFIIPLTKHGGIVDAKRTRHCVTSRYVSAKPNDANRNVKPKDIMPSLVYFNWRNGQRNRLCDWSLVLVIWTWACHLEVEWAACHLHLHGNERGLEAPHLQEENHISTLFIDLQQNEEDARVNIEAPHLNFAEQSQF